MVGAQPIGQAFEGIVDNDQLEITPCLSSKIEQPTGSSDRWPDGKGESAGGTLHLCGIKISAARYAISEPVLDSRKASNSIIDSMRDGE
jgi:hypothetical protein